MSEVKISAEPRTEFGKGPARRTRRAGRVPAVLYGHGTDPRHISLPGHELMLALKSANDIAVAMAERIGGSESRFAALMTLRAQELGMSNSRFVNANGLPDPDQMTTARDLAMLALALMRDFPQYYPYFRTQDFMLGKRKIGPGIKFLELYAPYADGLKTGFICSSGFNIVGSAVRDGRRLIAVALGFRRADLRDEFLVRLLDEAFLLKTGGNRP